MQSINWQGVIPAITTPFKADGAIDHDFLAKHCHWLIENGCTGVVVLDRSAKAVRFAGKKRPP